MITESKVIELFCIADDFCNFFDGMMAKYTHKPCMKHTYHNASTMSKAKIMLIMIFFHDPGYRCIKHFYKKRYASICVTSSLKSFLITVLLNLKKVAIPLALFTKKVLLSKCTDISFIDSTPLGV